MDTVKVCFWVGIMNWYFGLKMEYMADMKCVCVLAYGFFASIWIFLLRQTVQKASGLQMSESSLYDEDTYSRNFRESVVRRSICHRLLREQRQFSFVG